MPDSPSDIGSSLRPNDYITCIYDGYWWLVLIDAVNTEEKDLTCKFMHPHNPTNKFYWPRSDDKAYIPFTKVIMKVNPPTCSDNGRTFFIKEDELSKTNNYFNLEMKQWH